MDIKQMTRVPLFTALIVVFTVVMPPIPVPVIGINITLQTFVVMLAGLLLTPKEAFLSMILYLIIGALGFPVFSGQTGGVGMILGPSGGFLLSFPLAAFGISIFTQKQQSFTYFLGVNVLFGVLLVYAFGILVMSYYLSLPLSTITAGMLIFIPFDIIKAFLAASIRSKIHYILY